MNASSLGHGQTWISSGGQSTTFNKLGNLENQKKLIWIRTCTEYKTVHGPLIKQRKIESEVRKNVC